ncbi:MAG: GTP-binding protein [Candidatus Micrarchaeota archaeon]
MGLQEKIREIEEEMKRTQINKATEFHLGQLKAKLSKYKHELISPHRMSAGKRSGGFDMKKSGDATVAIIGMPSVGKSTLLNRITNAESKTAAYAFTTLKCIPGIMEYNKAKIQILDLPGIIEGAKDGKGRGREVIGVARSADLVLIMLEATNAEKEYHIILRELYGFGIRLNTKPPEIIIKKKLRGGLTMNATVKLTKITARQVQAVLGEYGMHNADIVFRTDADVDEFIDAVEGNRVYMPSIIVVNKIDLVGGKLLKKPSFDYMPISAEKDFNMQLVKDAIYRKLDFINIYTKRRGEKADIEEPMILRRGVNIGDVCEKLHRDLRKEFRYAIVWGKSVKHSAQRVGFDHVLADGDILYIVKK